MVAQRVKRLPAMQETRVRSLGWEDPLEKEMATHSSNLAWRIHGWRSLVGCSPRGHKESDTTEWLHFHFHFLFIHCPFDLHLCSLFPLTLCVIFSDSSRNNIYLQLLTVYLQNVMLIHGQCKILKSRIPYSSTHSLYSFFYSFLQYVL